MSRNHLSEESSPYLLQHKDNPVHWYGWGDAAFEAAKRDDKPILLSVGYAACHWCHVMAHESFENPEIAGLMNQLFVNIKVDREERPDLDTIYQSSLSLLGEQGGWPLTMFLTPDGEPFWGGTYFPPEPRYGRPGFDQVLRQVHQVYRESPDKITSNVAALRDGLTKLAVSQSGDTVTIDKLDEWAQAVVREIDPIQGGLNGAPKFPQSAIFEMLWRAYLRTGSANLQHAVTVTCDCMCQGGIYDHLGGGFARYSTDAMWLAPHFEKMLYDNAALIDLLTLVWQGTDRELYATRVHETVGWVLREMIADGGGFAASLDADSEGAEGKFYVWSEAEIDRILGPDAALFKRAYDVSAAGNWENTNILNRLRMPQLGDAESEAKLAALRETLLAAREERERPGWDDKVLADWNGLMIAALANAGAVFDQPTWIRAAVRAYNFVVNRMTVNGRLCHAARQRKARHAGMLDDYANMARAALVLDEVVGDGGYRAQAEAWIEILDRHFWDPAGGGYFFTADDAERLIVRTKSAAENATPPGNGTMVDVLAQLYYLTGNDDYRVRAEDIIRAFGGLIESQPAPLSFATMLNSAELLMTGQQIVIIGSREDANVQALATSVRAASLPNRVLAVIDPGTDLPPDHPAAGKGLVNARATAYFCEGNTCSLPLSTPDALSAVLPLRAQP